MHVFSEIWLGIKWPAPVQTSLKKSLALSQNRKYIEKVAKKNVMELFRCTYVCPNLPLLLLVPRKWMQMYSSALRLRKG